MSSRVLAVGAVAALAWACGAHSPRSTGAAREREARASGSGALEPERESAVSISGGTLALTRDGRALIAADPDRDLAWIVDLDTMVPRAPVALRAGDERGLDDHDVDDLVAYLTSL